MPGVRWRLDGNEITNNDYTQLARIGSELQLDLLTGWRCGRGVRGNFAPQAVVALRVFLINERCRMPMALRHQLLRTGGQQRQQYQR